MIKHFLRTLAVVLAGLAATVTAEAAVTTCLIVETTSETANYALSDQPVIPYSGENMLVGAVSYPIASIVNFRFGEADISTDAQESLSSGVSVSYKGGVYTISGLKDGVAISVFSINGNKISSVKSSEEGRAVVNTSSLPQGTYIVAGEGVSFKTIKK